MGRVTASDAELVEASRRGERAAFGELVERYQRVVCAVGYSGTSDRSLGEDVAQDTFVTAFHQLDQLRDVSRVREWLCGIARNLARKARRVRDREEVIDEAQPDVAGTPFDQTSEHERDTVVATALERVPETYREALVLYYSEQRSVPAVASALGISADAVHQRLSRGRQLVAAEVSELVEHTLERRRTRRNLAVAVLAALPVVTPSHANASPGGTSMLKLGIAASLVVALAGTGYAVHRSTMSPSSGASSSSASSRTVAQGDRTPGAAASRTRVTSASVPPALHNVVAANQGPNTCASVAKHLAALASATVVDPTPVAMTPDQVGHLQATLGSDVVVVVKTDHEPTDADAAQAGGGNTEQQCLDEHWPQATIDCLATVDDLWNIAARCSHGSPTDGPAPVAIAAVTDASCPTVGAHYATLVTPSLPTATDTDPMTALVLARIAAELADFAPQIEASCISSDWSESMRRCVIASSSMDQLASCQ